MAYSVLSLYLGDWVYANFGCGLVCWYVPGDGVTSVGVENIWPVLLLLLLNGCFLCTTSNKIFTM